MAYKRQSATLPLTLLGLTAVATVISAINPADMLTWWLEACPVIIGAVVLVATYKRFPFTSLVYVLIFIHALILLLGAHYTYAEVPLGFWFSDWLGMERNHYDRLGHIAQGFVPAMIAREVFLRNTPLKRGFWLFLFAVCFCLAFSAFYEMIEWWAALLSEEASESFLGTQGDNWDTQWDMFLALCGAITAQLLLRSWQDRQLERLAS